MADSGWIYSAGQVAPQPQVAEPKPVPGQFLDCENCGETIEEGDEAVQLFVGRSGRGKKSGQPTVVESQFVDSPVANLHVWCVAEYATVCIYEDQSVNYIEADDEETDIFCAGCGLKLDGES